MRRSELGFESKVLGKGVARTHALESPVICSFLRGLSVRDVEAALSETFEAAVVSKSTVARVCRDTSERYRQWCERRLEEHDLVYLFLDAIYLKLRPEDEPAEGVLCAWGITLEGQKVLIGLALGSRESYESWLDFGRDLIDRNLLAPALVVGDGAPGLWKAARELWPSAAEQRCVVHAFRSVTAKLPERHHPGGQGALVAPLRRGRVTGGGPTRTPRARRRLSLGLSLGRGSSVMWTRSSPTCDFPQNTAGESGAETPWRGPSSRSAGAPR